jgi:hypothetical protein
MCFLDVLADTEGMLVRSGHDAPVRGKFDAWELSHSTQKDLDKLKRHAEINVTAGKTTLV